ncbi:MAG: carbohydrate ABC transporter permease, partial [Eubacteriales bacterium]
MAKTNIKKRKSTKKIGVGIMAIYAILSAWALTTIYPFIWVILNSFRIKGEIRTDSFSIPTGESFTLDNYIEAFDSVDIGLAYTNSLIISVSVTVVVIFIAGLASFGMARYEFKGKKLVHSLIVASMMFPVFATIIPVFRLEVAMGIAGTSAVWKSLVATMLPQIAGNISFAMIVLMGFIKSLPIETEESAYLDGCNMYQIFFKIVMPMARPSFATVAIFAFLWSYNDLFTQMFFLRYPNTRTVTLLLNEISSQAGVDYGFMASSVVLVVVPVIFV